MFRVSHSFYYYNDHNILRMFEFYIFYVTLKLFQYRLALENNLKKHKLNKFMDSFNTLNTFLFLTSRTKFSRLYSTVLCQTFLSQAPGMYGLFNLSILSHLCSLNKHIHFVYRTESLILQIDRNSLG